MGAKKLREQLRQLVLTGGCPLQEQGVGVSLGIRGDVEDLPAAAQKVLDMSRPNWVRMVDPAQLPVVQDGSVPLAGSGAMAVGFGAAAGVKGAARGAGTAAGKVSDGITVGGGIHEGFAAAVRVAAVSSRGSHLTPAGAGAGGIRRGLGASSSSGCRGGPIETLRTGPGRSNSSGDGGSGRNVGDVPPDAATGSHLLGAFTVNDAHLEQAPHHAYGSGALAVAGVAAAGGVCPAKGVHLLPANSLNGPLLEPEDMECADVLMEDDSQLFGASWSLHSLQALLQ